mmetsp:Transcript_18744/g.58920  ORF Transcript_18744/g.58920 Transcript_18744/m.58920 type:complete len:200 (+) Transcript_18744:634-1233(+)
MGVWRRGPPTQSGSEALRPRRATRRRRFSGTKKTSLPRSRTTTAALPLVRPGARAPAARTPARASATPTRDTSGCCSARSSSGQRRQALGRTPPSPPRTNRQGLEGQARLGLMRRRKQTNHNAGVETVRSPPGRPPPAATQPMARRPPRHAVRAAPRAPRPRAPRGNHARPFLRRLRWRAPTRCRRSCPASGLLRHQRQ